MDLLFLGSRTDKHFGLVLNCMFISMRTLVDELTYINTSRQPTPSGLTNYTLLFRVPGRQLYQVRDRVCQVQQTWPKYVSRHTCKSSSKGFIMALDPLTSVENKL